MTPRLPLFAKILGWFFLNLLVLSLAGWVVLRMRVQSGIDSFLSGYVTQRVEPTARRILEVLAMTPEADWNAALANFDREHGVKFAVYSAREGVIAGNVGELPRAVTDRLPHARNQPPPPPRGGFDQGRPEMFGPRADETGFRPPPRGDETGFRPPPKGPPPGAGGPDGAPPLHDRFLLRTADPAAYWLGMFLPLRGRPTVVLAQSDTFTAGGFFFDFKPWLLVAGAALVLSALLWLPFVRGLTRALGVMRNATSNIADGRFDVRVDEQRRDELGELGEGINRLSTRLEGFVTGQKRFLGDIAHELCSPIARLQLALGILEQHANEKQKPYVDDVREEIQHMSDLVNELLSFSKASLKPGSVALKPVNVLEIARQAAHREAADNSAVEIRVPENCIVLASPEMLQRALSNLVRNALRYAGHAGPVVIAARQKGDFVSIVVADKGPGIPAEHLDKIFDTFYRIEPDRGRETGGVGLGLAIVKACVQACNGTLRARNRRSGGLKVSIVLPTAGDTLFESAAEKSRLDNSARPEHTAEALPVSGAESVSAAAPKV